MKIYNFTLDKTDGSGPMDWVYHASVDVENGLFWKEKERRKIMRRYAQFWFFVDSGEFAPDKVTALARSWTAKTGEQC